MHRKLEDILSLPASLATGGFAETIINSTTDQDSATFVSVANYRQVLGIFIVAAYDYGSAGNANTLTCTLLQGTTTAGAGKKVITGVTAVTFTAVGAKYICINTEDLDRDGGFDCVGTRLDSTGTDNHRVLALVIRGDARYAADTMPS